MNYKTKKFLRKINIFMYIKNFIFLKKYPFMKWYGDPLYIGYPHKKHYSLSYTWFDEIPYGWRKAFGKQMMKEIKKAGVKYLKENKDKKWSDILFWEQIKEKWGELCLYASAIEEIQNILDKYELMSIGYCICCGKPARYVTEGWISFQCEKCFEKNECWEYGDNSEKIPFTSEKTLKYKDKRRLTKKDIPELTNYEYKILKTEEFKTEEECKNRWNELWDSENRPKDMVYGKKEKEDGSWILEHEQQISHKVDIKEKYGIDFEKLWGIKE